MEFTNKIILDSLGRYASLLEDCMGYESTTHPSPADLTLIITPDMLSFKDCGRLITELTPKYESSSDQYDPLTCLCRRVSDMIGKYLADLLKDETGYINTSGSAVTEITDEVQKLMAGIGLVTSDYEDESDYVESVADYVEVNLDDIDFMRSLIDAGYYPGYNKYAEDMNAKARSILLEKLK